MVRRSPRTIKNSSSSGSAAASSASSALSTPPSIGNEVVSFILDKISAGGQKDGRDLEGHRHGTDEEEDDEDDESFRASDSDSDDVLTTRRKEIPDSSEVSYNTADEGGGFIVDDSDDILSPPAKRRRPTRRREWPTDLTHLPDDVITISYLDEALASSGEEHNDEEAVIPAPPVRHQNRKKKAPKKPLPYFDNFERKWYTNTEREQAKLYYRHDYLKRALDEIEPVVPINDGTVCQPKNMAFNLLPFQLEGLYWLKIQEQGRFRGGILADEMGMGKTIQTIALLLTEPRMKPNLIVMPTVALMQWRSEIEMHSKGSLSVYIFHGANREKNVKKLLDYDVILTTYSVIESTYRKEHYGFKRTTGVVKEKSPLHQMEFKRVILDEAHNIKDRANNTSKAVFAVKSEFRWCLSGTPLQNRIGELYSLIKFLRAEPFSNYFCKKCPCASKDWDFIGNSRCRSCDHRPMEHTSWFGTELLKPIQNHGSSDEGRAAFTKLHKLLKGIMLRRTKVERADDMGLPPRIVEVRRDYFNPEELDLYRSIFSNSKRQFNTYVRQGVVLNNYANIFTLITRMRQIADHPDLVLRKQGGQQDNSIVCRLCDDEAQEAIESRCHHTFCRVCIREYVEGFVGDASELTCPVCHVPLVIDLSAPAKQVDEEVVKKGSIINRIDMSRWHSSTKIEALVEELYKLRSDRQTIKSIVFSQFTSMLDLVEWRLKRAGFQLVKLQGSMSPLQRESTINHFMNTPSCEIFLVSLKAGGVALNLCEASQVFILDPWWNPSVEWQSGDRVHRIGQHRPVKITRLVIEDSIESRIIELQAKKADMIEATIGQDDTAMNRLTQQDMEFLFG